MGWIKEKLQPQAKNPNTKEQSEYVQRVQVDRAASEIGYREEIKPKWSDEKLCFRGDQWDTSFAPRDLNKKSKRYNLSLNVSLPTIMNIVDALTASTPEADLTGREPSDKMLAIKLSDLVSFVFYRNVFDKQWRDIVFQGVLHGPFIGCVEWDADFTGGAGPGRWVGEIRALCQKKGEIFFDPAIKDLEEDLQDCRFIHQRIPKNLDYIQKTWDNGKYVTPEMFDETEPAHDMGYKRAVIIKSWHRGTPKFISQKDKERFLQLAEEASDEFKKQDYLDMADGKLEGIHCGYTAGEIFLDYVPYVYEDGLYPFAYAVLYQDEDNPYGFGEMRNVLPIQVAYNKCAEIEMAAAAVEGLGGGYYNKGSISKAQLDEILANAHKAGVWLEVMRKEGMQKREGTQTPQSLVLFKDFLKTNIDTTTQNTAIQQGVSPGANVPFASIKELGSRADVRNKGKMNILERFMTQFIRLVISRIKQFYTDDREYRIRGNKSDAIKTLVYDGIQQLLQIEDTNARLSNMIQLVNTIETSNPEAVAEYDTFNNEEIKRTWNREGKKEEYMVDFDIKVKIADERPTSRSYYEQVAMAMYGRALGPKAFWYIIENGKFPSAEEIMQELNEIQKQMVAQSADAQAMTSTQTAEATPLK